MFKKICYYITLIFLFLLFPIKSFAVEVKPYLVTEGFEIVVPSDIKTYFYKTTQINYQSGKVLLSLNPDGTGDTYVGEEVEILVNSDNIFRVFTTNINCTKNKMPPLDITHLMDKGFNGIRVTYRKTCYNSDVKYHDQLHIVHFNDYEPTDEPFLDLPWDYKNKGMTFDDAANSMTSYFDHEYPLLSAKWFLGEPEKSQLNILKYSGAYSDESYTSHDGYDYAYPSNAFLNDPVLAAAPGIATYHDECSACGNAIHIDHLNGYQTRYYHLKPEELITNAPNTSIGVNAKEQIGKVGLTGMTDGAHIHFMVIQDKNNDGNFEDNIPDGIVDPYGWHGSDPDPWEQFTFEQNGIQRIGAKSRYLWKNKLSKLSKTLSPDGGTYNSNRYTFTFPKDATSKDIIFTVNPVTDSEPSAELNPIGYIVEATAEDGFGNFIEQFSKFFTITIKLLSANYSRYKPESLSIYSSQDGKTWQKENTAVDLDSKTAVTQVNHLTYFAFMGEKKDSIAPETTLLINDNSPKSEYTDPVNLILNSLDAPAEDSLGIENTFIKINDTDWATYVDPITITDVGEYTVQYYSTDKDGNSEEVKEASFLIQEEQIEQPEFELSYNFSTNNFEIKPLHTNNEIQHNEKQIKKEIFDIYSTFNRDLSTELIINYPDKNKKDVIKFDSIKYNDSNPVELEGYKYNAYTNLSSDTEKIVQKFQNGKDEEIKLTYNSNKDITTIIKTINEAVISSEIVSGFKQLNIITSNQNLDFEIK